LLASSAAKTAINVTLKSRGFICEPAFTDSPHQVESSARPIVLIASDDVGGASLETEATVYAREKFVFVAGDGSGKQSDHEMSSIHQNRKR
jgi:hypothetical protein